MSLLRDWADAEGWNPGHADGPAFFATDPQGFLIGRLDGEPAGRISVVRYGAASPEVAAALVGALAATTSGEPVAIDVPDFNTAAVGLVERLGLAPTFETARMYTGPAPEIDRAGLFGVTSLELG
ncbi:hypothetical protein [Streptomyces sp. H27-C3]|uniref:hypothetical protein n=1 Tax=Streptomyces sp. H27-C3 TaxID=3046305 RepID=UPI0024BA062E|nr:hypothetical protein [Streptomyces sp. H27-C3]MDJ0461924.1 hypothetical protein [Streptomyces sp. H27-C3]